MYVLILYICVWSVKRCFELKKQQLIQKTRLLIKLYIYIYIYKE